MIEFFNYIKDNIVYLLSLWADEKIADMIGANFLYLILTIWLTWIVVNMYLIRPLSGSLFGTGTTQASQYESKRKKEEKIEEQKAETQHKEDIRVGKSSRYDF